MYCLLFGGHAPGGGVEIPYVDRDGNDATNPVTYMMLQSAGRLVLHDPPQALRIHEGTPAELWEAAIETTKIAGGVPSFESDKVIIAALMMASCSFFLPPGRLLSMMRLMTSAP